MRTVLYQDLEFQTFLTQAPWGDHKDFYRFDSALSCAQTCAAFREPLYYVRVGKEARWGCYTTPGGRVVCVIERHVPRRQADDEIYPGGEAAYLAAFENTEGQGATSTWEPSLAIRSMQSAITAQGATDATYL